jgi:nitroreductase
MKEINIRRSIRKYTGQAVSEDQIDQLLRAAMQAPSAGNQQPWEFIVVEDQDLLEKASKMSPYSAMVKDASVAIVFLVNEENMRFPDNWQQDLSAATQNLLLEAVSLELGAVWLGIAPVTDRMKFISDLFNLPPHVKPFSLVPVGYPAEENKFVDRFDEKRIHRNRY